MTARTYAAPVDGVTSDVRARRLVVAVMLGAIALDQGGEPAAAPALAGAASAFGIGMRAAAWLTMSYNIGYLAATIVSVWAIVRFGKRSYFTVSLAIYAVASIACAAAPTAEALIVARFVLGASAGGLFTSALLTIVGTSPKSDLPIAMTVFAAVTLLAPTLAPLYAGIALQGATWRAVFAGFALLAAAGALLAHLWMTDVAAPKAQSFDRTTFGLLLVGLASYQFLVNQGANVRWFAQPSVFVAGALVAITLVAYAVRELRVSPTPFLDLRVFENDLLGRGLTVGLLLGALLGTAGIEASYARTAFSFGPIALGEFVGLRAFGIVIGVGLAQWLTLRQVPAWMTMSGGMIAVAGTCLAQGSAIAMEASAPAHAFIGIMQGAAFALVLGPLATTLFNAVDRTAFATLAVLFKLSFLIGSGLTFAVAATVTSQVSDYASADEELWLGAAIVAFVTATWTTSLRPATEATA